MRIHSNNTTIVIAATNRVETLDAALLRSGRFDRRIHIALPSPTDRVSILMHYLKGKEQSVDLEHISKATSGFSGAELETLVNESLLLALKQESTTLKTEHILETISRVKHGIVSHSIITQSEKEVIANYKAAKAYWLGVNKYDFEQFSMMEDDFELDQNRILSSTDLIKYMEYYMIGSVSLKLTYDEYFTLGLKDQKELATLNDLYIKIDSEPKSIDEIKQGVITFVEKNKTTLQTIANLIKEQERLTSEELRALL